MRELEFLPEWYRRARKQRRRLVLQSWGVIAVGAGLLWAVLPHGGKGLRSITGLTAPAPASAAMPPIATPPPAARSPQMTAPTSQAPRPTVNVRLIDTDDATSNQSDPAGAESELHQQKSIVSPADLAAECALKAVQVRQWATGLHLQSTMTRPTPKALVNGQVVEVGEMVEAFRVLKISADGVLVERDGIELEIKFEK